MILGSFSTTCRRSIGISMDRAWWARCNGFFYWWHSRSCGKWHGGGMHNLFPIWWRTVEDLGWSQVLLPGPTLIDLHMMMQLFITVCSCSLKSIVIEKLDALIPKSSCLFNVIYSMLQNHLHNLCLDINLASPALLFWHLGWRSSRKSSWNKPIMLTPSRICGWLVLFDSKAPSQTQRWVLPRQDGFWEEEACGAEAL